MKKVTREELKNKIVKNFIKVIEAKPEIKNDDMIKKAYQKLKEENWNKR